MCLYVSSYLIVIVFMLFVLVFDLCIPSPSCDVTSEAVVQQVEWVVWQLENCWFNTRLQPAIVKVSQSRTLNPNGSRRGGCRLACLVTECVNGRMLGKDRKALWVATGLKGAPYEFSPHTLIFL